MNSIQSRVPRADYDALEAINITRLKNLKRSPLHYQYALAHQRVTPALTVGIATHTAVLEPERFDHDFAVWSNRTESGRASPRNGKVWDAFRDLHAARTILTDDEASCAKAIAGAVRAHEGAMKYLAAGDPEVTLEWQAGARRFKGRADWLTKVDGENYLVGLKTTRDCRHMVFGSQAAKLLYHCQWAFYHDGFEAITGTPPNMVEIVVESEAPHAVAVFLIPEDIIQQGRDEYQGLLRTLAECEATGLWPGPVPTEELLTLPSWAYTAADEDLSDLGLEAVA